MAGERVLAVFVGQAAQTNFQVGLNAGTWGFKDGQPQYADLQPGDLILLASGFTGGSPRVQFEDWERERLQRVVLGRLTTGIYDDDSPLWPDEGATVSYPHRVRFEELKTLHDVALDEPTLGREVSEALRMSVNRGIGRVAPASGRIFEGLVDEPVDPVIDPLLGLNRATLPNGSKAPHKPMLVLLALARAKVGRSRLAHFDEWAEPLGVLLRRETGVGSDPGVAEPIWRMQKDGVWEVLQNGSPFVPDAVGEPTKTQLRQGNVLAGLIQGVHDPLAGDADLLERTAVRVANHYFADRGRGLWGEVQKAIEVGRRIWWVNQRDSYATQRDGWFVWAPLTNKSGHPEAHHTNVSLLSSGDVVIHYAKGHVRAIGEVVGPPQQRLRPASLPGEPWNVDGHYCCLEYFELDSPLPLEQVPQRLDGGPFTAQGTVQQRYLLPVTAAQEAAMYELVNQWPPQSPLGTGSRRHWLFQANPAQWDLEKMVDAVAPGAPETFTLSRFRDEVHVGDAVVLWQSGPRAGVYALAEISGEPFERPRPEWRQEGPETETAVPLRYKRILTSPIARTDAQAHPVLRDMQVLRAPQGTNFKLTKEEWQEIVRLSDTEPPEPPPPSVTLSDVCDDVAQRLADAHLHFGPRHREFVGAAMVSLATKRFLILTGLSGSGKTRLAIGIGQWFGVERMRVVAVRPDWTGPDALLGYENGLSEVGPDGRHAWVVPPALEFILEAARTPNEPHMLLLDEMNLAHVERYFADVLSGMESGEAVIPNLHRTPSGEWRPAGPDLPFPRNLFVVGTVNIDETTYMFSPKVLDRANTLEFRVHSSDLRSDAQPIQVVEAGTAPLVQRFLLAATELHGVVDEAVAFALSELHDLLSGHDREFGHRVYFEALRFARLWADAGGDAIGAIDLQVLQKVLPRFHGSIRQVADALNTLGAWCYGGPEADLPAQFDPLSVDGQAALPLSFDKVQRMVRRLRGNHFVGFAE